MKFTRGKGYQSGIQTTPSTGNKETTDTLIKERM
jgi:hypothetical protein